MVTFRKSYKWICEDIIKVISASRIFEFLLRHYNWNLPTLHSRNMLAGGRAPASISQKNCPPQNHTDHKNSHSALQNWEDLQKLLADTRCAILASIAEHCRALLSTAVPAAWGAADCSTAALQHCIHPVEHFYRTGNIHENQSSDKFIILGCSRAAGQRGGQEAQTLHQYLGKIVKSWDI